MKVHDKDYPAGVWCHCGSEAVPMWIDNSDERIIRLYRCGSCGDIFEVQAAEVKIVGGGASDEEVEKILER